METKFTKGEWSIGDVNTKIVGTNKPDIKYIAICDQDKDIYNEEAEANAKLIASAPCLLDALEYGKQISEKLRFPTEEELKQFVNMATEAIKKATE